jgi:hypothetical protein
MVHPLDFGALDALRIDRGKRGFLDRSALC